MQNYEKIKIFEIKYHQIGMFLLRAKNGQKDDKKDKKSPKTGKKGKNGFLTPKMGLNEA